VQSNAAKEIVCASCSLPVPDDLFNRGEQVRCPWCSQNIQVLVFPAVRNAQMGAVPVALEGEAEASCFYHPQSRAAQVCAECGRFLCNLCDLDVDGRHICPRCFETVGVEKVENRRPMYDTMALAMSTLPALLFWPALVSAPWALFLVVRRWNAPSSIVPRTKIRFVLAALFALAEIGFIVFAIYMLTQVAVKAPRPHVITGPKI
jgi:DNA-directed RNA polymerase subunit RPC12/RpoP